MDEQMDGRMDGNLHTQVAPKSMIWKWILSQIIFLHIYKHMHI